MNLSEYLISGREILNSKIALITPNQAISYRELQYYVLAATIHLKNHGIRQGMVIAVTFSSEVLLAIGILSTTLLGATAMPVPRSATTSQRESWCKTAGVSCLLTDEARNLDSEIPEVRLSASDLTCKPSLIAGLIPKSPEAPFMIGIGSGSTGKPKLIPISHDNFYYRCLASQDDDLGFIRERFLSLSNLHFTSVISRFLNVIFGGGSFFLDANLLVQQIRRFSQEMKVEVLSMSVLHAQMLLRNFEAIGGNQNLSFLRGIRIGGSTVSQDLRIMVREQLNENLHIGYGTNETGVITRISPPDVYSLSGSVGTTAKVSRIQVRGESEEVQQPGVAGDLWVQTAGMIESYYGDDKNTALKFKDGWFSTGDTGVVDANGYLTLLGRSDRMMILNGINIFPEEIERCLLSHPNILDAAVFPIRHEVHQDIPISLVQTDSKHIDEQQLLTFSRGELGFKSPIRILIVREIPRSSNGKLDFHRVTAIVEEFLTKPYQ